MSSTKSLPASLAQRAQWRITRAILAADEVGKHDWEHHADLEIVLSWVLNQVSSSGRDIHYPLEFIEFVRGCLKQTSLQVQVIKNSSASNNDIPARRFSLLIDTMKNLPPVDLQVAQDLALLADSYQVNLAPMEAGASWIGDIALHFRWSSSLGEKGRILSSVVRIMQSEKCLELGTAYGMSAAFILEMLRAAGSTGHLTTLEGSKLLYNLSSKILEARYGDRVSCRQGWTQDVLHDLVRSLQDVDFLFHDAGHSREDYVRDFATVLSALKPGAVILIDDIRWNDPSLSQEDPRCYDGWIEVAKHPRVRQAVEINNELGLMLLN